MSYAAAFELMKSAKRTRSDCTVVALVIVAMIPYERAEQIAADGGRKPGHAAYATKVIEAAKRHGLHFRKLRGKTLTVRKFIERHPVGRFYVRHTGHAFAIIDGIVNDTTAMGCRITHAWAIDEPTNGS